MSAQISTPETNGAIPGAPGPPPGTKRGTAAYVIGAKDLNPSWVMLYAGTLALQFGCAFIRAMVAYVILWLAFTIGRHSTAPVNTLALVVAYGPLVLSFATLILPLGGWWWEQQSGGRSPSERERLVFEDAITSLTYHDPDLRPPRRWFVTDEQEQNAAVYADTLKITHFGRAKSPAEDRPQPTIGAPMSPLATITTRPAGPPARPPGSTARPPWLHGTPPWRSTPAGGATPWRPPPARRRRTAAGGRPAPRDRRAADRR